MCPPVFVPWMALHVILHKASNALLLSSHQSEHQTEDNIQYNDELLRSLHRHYIKYQ